jgi:hypothetical protein
MKWRQRDVAVTEALRAALIGSTYGCPFINMPCIDIPHIYMPHIDNPRFRLHYTLHYIDMPCIDMPRLGSIVVATYRYTAYPWPCHPHHNT